MSTSKQFINQLGDKMNITTLLVRRNLAVYDCMWKLVKKLDSQLLALTGKTAKELNVEHKLK